jgi:hypothetical protein
VDGGPVCRNTVGGDAFGSSAVSSGRKSDERIRLDLQRQRVTAVAAAREVGLRRRAFLRGQPAIRITRQHFGVEAVVSRLDLMSSNAKANEPI